MDSDEKYGLALLIVLVIVVIIYYVHKHFYGKGGKASFGDLDGWPGSGSFGNQADTNPYGNYADGQARYWPTMNQYAPYWTSA